MPIGYGYQSSDAASYVNWAAVTKGFTDVLDADIADKRKREAEYEKQDRELSQTLADQPLGQFEDGNTFTNNFVDAMTNQRLIDYKLFKSGRLKEKDYRLKTNNAIDGTNTIFDLQKKYQEASADRMKGLQDESYQPLTANSMALIEGFKDFKDSVPIIDPKTGIINIAKKKYNEKTKTWDIEYGKTMPVNMAMSLISTPALAYKINPIIDKDVAAMGTLKDALYDAATTTKAGTITALLGPEGFKKYPEAAGIITNFNNAVNGKVEEYLTNTLHTTSILTMNVGGYSAESFTYDKAEAAKDPKKILMKIDPSSKYPTMDKSGPNYEKQKEEAASWIKTQFMSRIDRERTISATGQISRQPITETERSIQNEKDDADNLAKNLVDLASGDAVLSGNAAKALASMGIPVRVRGNKFIVDSRDAQGNSTGEQTFDGSNMSIPKLIQSLVNATNPEGVNKKMVERKVAELSRGKSISSKSVGDIKKVKKSRPDDEIKTAFANTVKANKVVDLIDYDNPKETADNLKNAFEKYGFTFKGDYNVGWGGKDDYITITGPGKYDPNTKTTTPGLSSGRIKINDKSNSGVIEKWITDNFDKAKLLESGDAEFQDIEVDSPAEVEAKKVGVGAQYN
jgi:hypothetical protein